MSRLVEDIKYLLNRQSAWHGLRQWQALETAEALRRLRLWPRILRTPPTRSEPWRPGLPLEIHTMCHEADWLLLVWMLKSLARVAGKLPPLVIHLQRLPRPSAVAEIRRHFPDARILAPEEDMELVASHLVPRGLVRCMHWWHRTPILHKLVTVQASATATNIAWIDSDVLFFSRPAEMLDATGGPLEKVHFQLDCGDSFSIPPEFARERLGIRLPNRINAGLVLRSRESIRLELVETLLAHPEIACRSGLMEQTIQALCASHDGRAAHLPPTYMISLEPRIPLETAVCRHYAGGSRRWMTQEGIRHLIDGGILGR